MEELEEILADIYLDLGPFTREITPLKLKQIDDLKTTRTDELVSFSTHGIGLTLEEVSLVIIMEIGY